MKKTDESESVILDKVREMLIHSSQSKPKTLCELESDLEYFESFIKKCITESRENFDLAFTLDDQRVSYENIQELSLDERYKLALKVSKDVDDYRDVHIMRAIKVLYVMGFKDLSKEIAVRNIDYVLSKFYKPKIEHIKSEIKRKEITSKGGKGRTNKHKDEALKIAVDTWTIVKNASRSSLSFKIYNYLNKKYKGIPVPGTIEGWLKNSNIDPKVVPNTNDYELIIKD